MLGIDIDLTLTPEGGQLYIGWAVGEGLEATVSVGAEVRAGSPGGFTVKGTVVLAGGPVGRFASASLTPNGVEGQLGWIVGVAEGIFGTAGYSFKERPWDNAQQTSN